MVVSNDKFGCALHNMLCTNDNVVSPFTNILGSNAGTGSLLY